jgi:hypothetical protein
MICFGFEVIVVDLHPFIISIRININVNTRFLYAIDDTPMYERDELQISDDASVLTWALSPGSRRGRPGLPR